MVVDAGAGETLPTSLGLVERTAPLGAALDRRARGPEHGLAREPVAEARARVGSGRARGGAAARPSGLCGGARWLGGGRRWIRRLRAARAHPDVPVAGDRPLLVLRITHL